MGTTDIPILNCWWRLRLVLKPEYAALILTLVTFMISSTLTITLFVILYSVCDCDLPSQVGKGRFHSPFPTHQIDPKSNKIIFSITYKRCSSSCWTCFNVTCIILRKEDSSMRQVWRNSTPSYKKTVYWNDLGDVILLIYTVTNTLIFSWLSGTYTQHLITLWIINNSSEFLEFLEILFLDDHVYYDILLSEGVHLVSITHIYGPSQKIV